MAEQEVENPTSEPTLVSSSNDDGLAGQMLRAQELGDSAETARLLGELIDRRIATANTSRDGDHGNSAVATVQKFFERENGRSKRELHLRGRYGLATYLWASASFGREGALLCQRDRTMLTPEGHHWSRDICSKQWRGGAESNHAPHSPPPPSLSAHRGQTTDTR